MRGEDEIHRWKLRLLRLLPFQDDRSPSNVATVTAISILMWVEGEDDPEGVEKLMKILEKRHAQHN